MRPLKLTMSAFASYASKQEIDFTLLNGRSIFLITGKTGAGKTTIFDAISYALFGSPSGDFRDVASLRSHYADGAVKTYVELEFELRGNIYKITRSPEQYINKMKGTGLKKEIATAVLEFSDGQKPITRIKDVDEAIRDIIGVDKDQFKQIVMLPQGEFLRLLKASSSDREKIFRKIFGTEQFNKIQDKLSLRRKALDKELEGSKRERSVHVKNIKYPDGNILESLVKADDIDIESVLENVKVLIADDKNFISEKTKKQEEEKQKLKVLAQKKYSLEQDKNAIKEFDKARVSLETHKQKLDIVKNSEEKLESGKRARNVKLVEDKFKTSEEQLSFREERYTLAVKNLKDSEFSLKEAELKLVQEKNNEKLREKLALDIEELTKQEELVSNYDTKKKKCDQLSENEKNLLSKIEKLEKSLKEDEAILKVLEKEIAEILEKKLKLQAVMSEGKSLAEDIKKLEKLESRYLELNKKRDSHKLKSVEFETFEKVFKNSKDEFEFADDAFKKGQAGLLAQLLVDGEACPVCGSCEHPKKAIKKEDVPTEEVLNNLKKEYEKVSRKKEQLLRELTVINNDKEAFYKDVLEVEEAELLELLNSDFLSLDESQKLQRIQDIKSELNVKRVEARGEYSKLNADVSKFGDKSKKKDDLEVKTQNTTSEINISKNDLNNITSELSAAKENLKNIEKIVPEELRNKEIILSRKSEMISRLNFLKNAFEFAQKSYMNINEKYSANKKSVEISLGEVEKSKKEAHSYKVEFTQSLKNEKFADYDEYKACLTTGDLEELEKRIKNYYEQLKALETLYEKAERDVSKVEFKDIDKLDENLGLVLDEIKKLEDLDEELTKEINLFENRSVHNKDCLEKIKLVSEKISDKEEVYKNVAHLSYVAAGDKGNDKKISFESYILTSYFDEIIIMANQRLDKMTNGRFYLSRKEGESRGNGRKGLELEIFDNNTGSLRGINSISGGESFKAALSLALGLADVIQSYAGGISIDTMFIDEGFGTLDPQSLDSAIECLLNLQQGGRVVGIISHVAELKERIDARLEVTPSDTEGSKAEFIIK